MSIFEQKLEQYFDKFNRNYPLLITGDFDEEDVIKDIDECIKNNTPKDSSELNADLIY